MKRTVLLLLVVPWSARATDNEPNIVCYNINVAEWVLNNRFDPEQPPVKLLPARVCVSLYDSPMTHASFSFLFQGAAQPIESRRLERGGDLTEKQLGAKITPKDRGFTFTWSSPDYDDEKHTGETQFIIFELRDGKMDWLDAYWESSQKQRVWDAAISFDAEGNYRDDHATSSSERPNDPSVKLPGTSGAATTKPSMKAPAKKGTTSSDVRSTSAASKMNRLN